MAPSVLVTLALMAASAAGALAPPPARPPPPRMPRPAPPPPSPPPLRDVFLPPGRGYDWSLAGYMDGLAPIPANPSSKLFNVKLAPFNARGDGQTDDTAALQAAVAAAALAGEGVIYLPEGRYVLREPLVLRNSKTVIRGGGEGRTVIRIPVSLSDVYAGTWVQQKDGSIKSSWSFGGAFIQFSGTVARSRDTRNFLAKVSGEVPARSRRIPVSATASFSVGQWVSVFVNDVSTGGSRRRLTATSGAAAAATAAPTVTRVTDPATGHNITLVGRAVPAWVASSVAYQAAVEGALAFDESDEPGVTPQQALALDAAAATAAGMIGIAAAPGTVAYWLYGDGLADSGPRDGAVDRDEVSLSARVAAIGNGWIELDRELPFPVQPGWDAVVHSYNPRMQHSGIEKLTIAFDHSIVGPHFTDRGYNAIQIRGAANFWIRQVTILNSDNSIFFNWVEHSTIADVTVDVTTPRWAPEAYKNAENGHHPICLAQGHNNHVTRTHIRAKYIHDFTVASGTTLNVFDSCSGRDVNLDHHRAGPFANLFTDIDVGYGTRWYWSGGRSDRGANTGVGSTFWNIRASANAPPPPPRPVPSPRPPPRPRSSPPPPRPRPPRPPPPSRPPPSPEPPTPSPPPPPPPPSPPSPAGGTSKNAPAHRPRPAPPIRRQAWARPSGMAQTIANRAPQPPARRAASPGGSRRLRFAEEQAAAGAGAAEAATAAAGAEAEQHVSAGHPSHARGLSSIRSIRALPLPPCGFGPGLNFIGRFTGDQCPEMDWLVLPLTSGMPENLWVAQRVRRGLAP